MVPTTTEIASKNIMLSISRQVQRTTTSVQNAEEGEFCINRKWISGMRWE